MAQFYGQPVDYKDSTSEWKGLQDIAQNAYNMDQTRDLNKLFSESIDDKGNPNEKKFYAGVRAKGLNPQAAQEILKYNAAQKAAALNDAQTNMMIRQFGGNPMAGGRNGASIGEPEPQVVANPEYTPPVVSSGVPGPEMAPQAQSVPQPVPQAQPQAQVAPQPLTPESFGDYFQTLKNKAAVAREQLGLTPKTSMNEDGTTNTGLTPSTLGSFLGVNGNTDSVDQSKAALARFLGMQYPETPSVNIAAPDATQDNSGSFILPELPAGQSPTTLVPGQDNRSARQLVEDSYNPSESQFGGAAKAAGVPSVTVDSNTPPQIKQSIATTLAVKHYDNDGSDASINKALDQYRADKIAAVGPPPMLLPGEKGINLDEYGKRVQEWNKNLSGIKAQIQNDLGTAYAEQFTRDITSASNARAQIEQQNQVAQKNAELKAASNMTANIGALVKKDPVLGKLPNLDPMTFTGRDDIAKFGERTTAYNKLGKEIPKTPLEILAWAKNFSQAEGLGEAEGTRNMLMMLGAPDKASRLQVALANGHDFSWATLVGTGVADELSKLKPAQISDLKQQMKFSQDYMFHSGANTTPTMQTGGSDVPNYRQSMGQGSKDNPIPYEIGMKAVKGKYYNVPGHGIVEGTD